MTYSDPVLLEALVQRYVLGTMSYRARRRFAQILARNSAARELVMSWEERLAPMVENLDPLPPSELVWQRIIREINSERSRDPAVKISPVKYPAMTAVFAILVVSLSVTSLGWLQSDTRPGEKIVESIVEVVPEAASVSVLAVADSTFWVARVYPRSSRLEITVHSEPDRQPGKDYQLWALQDDGTPVSLGLLPKTGQITRVLEQTALEALARSDKLAVSLEPLGGSPLATPTGPVLLAAPIYVPSA